MFTRKAGKQSTANSFTKCILTFLTAFSNVSSQTKVEKKKKKHGAVVSDSLLVFQLCRLWLLVLWKVWSPDIFHEWPAFSDQKHSSNGVEYDDTGYHQTNFPTYFVGRITSHHKCDGSLLLSKNVDFDKTIGERTRELSFRTPLKDQRMFMSLMFAKVIVIPKKKCCFWDLSGSSVSSKESPRLCWVGYSFSWLTNKACKCLIKSKMSQVHIWLLSAWGLFLLANFFLLRCNNLF